MSDSDNKHPPNARLCHVIKTDDFDGYGFNLHAEKGKPGQYIGKVDEGSPAELAGLRQGDRILEVNGVSIKNETHKQVISITRIVASVKQFYPKNYQNYSYIEKKRFLIEFSKVDLFLLGVLESYRIDSLFGIY